MVSPERAHAFTEPRTYFDDPASGGGGGRFFTGSPAEGYGCDVCHSGGTPAQLELQGLPERYEPGESYELRLRWPALARHARELREQGEQVPAMGLVAELVTQSGQGAGTLELSEESDADERELCVLPAGEPAARLYAVRPGEHIAEQGGRCDADGLGERCVAAVVSCGAEELRLRWTAPQAYQGTLWLSAGLVATDDAQGDAARDGVTMLERTIQPASAQGDPYTRQLHGGCSAALFGGSGASSDLAHFAGALLGLLALRRVRALRKRLRASALLASVLLLAGCMPEASEPAEIAASDAGSLLGLHTPGTLGTPPDEEHTGVLDGGGGLSSDELRRIEDAIRAGDESEACEPYKEVGDPGTQATLEIAFSTRTYGGRFTPENCGAVWIEDEAGNYVATPAIWAEQRIRNLFIWDARRCESDFPDVITSATLGDHTKPHEVTWNGKTHAGDVAPDGSYVLNIEVTEDEFNYGRRLEVPFEKGSEPFVLEPEDGESVLDLVLEYTPKASQ